MDVQGRGLHSECWMQICAAWREAGLTPVQSARQLRARGTNSSFKLAVCLVVVYTRFV
jgi:hypothetical protein